MDPQSNSSSGIGLSKENIEQSIYDILINNVSPKEVIKDTVLEYLKILPSSISLVGAEIEMVNMMSREHQLKKVLTPIADNFDYVIIDCPPFYSIRGI